MHDHCLLVLAKTPRPDVFVWLAMEQPSLRGFLYTLHNSELVTPITTTLTALCSIILLCCCVEDNSSRSTANAGGGFESLSKSAWWISSAIKPSNSLSFSSDSSWKGRFTSSKLYDFPFSSIFKNIAKVVCFRFKFWPHDPTARWWFCAQSGVF